MKAGDLRSRVSFYAPVLQDDGYGNTTSGFSDTANFTVWANIAPRLGGEKVLADRLTGTNYANITVRSSSNTRAVTTEWRASDARTGSIYNIRSIIDPSEGGADHGAALEMLCEKGVAA